MANGRKGAIVAGIGVEQRGEIGRDCGSLDTRESVKKSRWRGAPISQLLDASVKCVDSEVADGEADLSERQCRVESLIAQVRYVLLGKA
jgi:hypothetical protein